MKKLNWSSFGVKFNGQEQKAFERMAYELFCSRFGEKYGIFAFKNQVAIETEPIEINGIWIGFQAKYLEPASSFNSYKKKIINSLITLKEKHPKIGELYFYVNKTYSESKGNVEKLPQYILDIEKKASELKFKIIWQVPSQIEKQLSNPENLLTAKEFFPELIEKELIPHKNEELLELHRTAIIQVEIAKLKFDFTNDWAKNEEILEKLNAYVDFTNEIIARDILNFLNNKVSNAARSNMPSSIACSIESLVFSYFPSSFDDKNKEMRINNGKKCISIGYNLAYDALIHTNNFRVAQWGLSIWKFIYRESNRSDMPDLTSAVLEQFKSLEDTLKRPERNDLENARELVKAFKDDLESFHLSIPVLPANLYSLIQNSI